MSQIIYALISLELLIVAWGDFKTKRIPLLWSILNIIVFILFVIFLPEYYEISLSSLFYSLAFFVVGFGLFYLNIMGGGDSKFLATLFLLIPNAHHEIYFTCLLYVTVVVGGFLLLKNTLMNYERVLVILSARQFSDLKQIYGKKFVYAPVMFVSWLVYGYIIKIWN